MTLKVGAGRVDAEISSFSKPFVGDYERRHVRARVCHLGDAVEVDWGADRGCKDRIHSLPVSNPRMRFLHVTVRRSAMRTPLQHTHTTATA